MRLNARSWHAFPLTIVPPGRARQFRLSMVSSRQLHRRQRRHAAAICHLFPIATALAPRSHTESPCQMAICKLIRQFARVCAERDELFSLVVSLPYQARWRSLPWPCGFSSMCSSASCGTPKKTKHRAALFQELRTKKSRALGAAHMSCTSRT